MKTEVSKFVCRETDSIRSVIKLLVRECKITFVIAKNSPTIVVPVSDGDIRCALLDGMEMTDAILFVRTSENMTYTNLVIDTKVDEVTIA